MCHATRSGRTYYSGDVFYRGGDDRVAHKPTLRQLLVAVLAFWKDRSQKEIEAAANLPPKGMSRYLRRGEIPDDVFGKLLDAVECPPDAVFSVTACLESLEILANETDLTAKEKAEIADALLRIGRRARNGLIEAARHSRTVTSEGSPGEAHAAAYDRQRAAALFRRLEDLPPAARLALVEVDEEHWSWALCERVCEASVREASRKLERAAAWAHLARQIAERVRGPEEWRDRLRGYAAAHGANVLRVSGDLGAADVTLEEARRLWRAGSDPGGVLDPGRILHLEGALRRDQRRLPEALALLDEAATVGRSPERALLQKGYTFEVMGEYEQAVKTLLRAAPLILQQGDPRLESILSGNLALNYCHLGRFEEASLLARQVCAVALETGDEIEALRMTWIQGRIAAGLGRTQEARSLLAQARRGFAARGMRYDVVLALLEEAALLLEEGRGADVKHLTRELTVLFDAKGVHREALAALRLFQEAVEQERATADLARRVLRYLFRARHDPDLRFPS
jgi:tetratricopeptide (TPR) repeat protein